MPGIGTLANAALVLIGTAIGLLFGHLIHDRFKRIAMTAIGLSTIAIGLQMALKTENALVLVGGLALGGLTGELLGIEAALERFGVWLESVAKRIPFFGAGETEGEGERRTLVEGFVTASLLYCVGAMAVVGSLQDGLGNPSTLYLKGVLDGIASIALASTLGIGVGFSVIPILILQGGIALGAHTLQPWLTTAVVREMSAAGGMLIAAIGIDLIGVKRLPVGNLMPAVVFAAVLGGLFA